MNRRRWADIRRHLSGSGTERTAHAVRNGYPGPSGEVPDGDLRPAGRPAVSTLSIRIIGITVLVAVLVAGTAGAVAVAAVQRTAVEANTTRVRQQAELLSAEFARSTDSTASTVVQSLAAQGLSVVTVVAGTATGPPVAVAVVRALGLTAPTAALPYSGSVRLGGIRWLIEARPTSATGGSFAVVADADDGAVSARVLLRRIVIAMLIGLGVAIPAGLVSARLVTRPLRRTAELANAMGTGRRDLRVDPAGPAEVQEVAHAVNRLADALSVSEGRQQRFLASVSHELRTPLAAVSGLADALADGLIPSTETAAVGGTIRAEAARLERLVADLLDLARLRASEFTLDTASVDVSSVVAGMDRAWRIRCEQRDVVLTVDAEQGPLPAEVDERRLRQVLDGLMENALRVLPPGRPLIVRCGADRTPGGPLVRIEIRDGGPGLTSDDYRVAFEPGVLHERYRLIRPGGAGLGLALAHALVTRMGGTLHLEPAAEGGVCCTVTFPMGQQS